MKTYLLSICIKIELTSVQIIGWTMCNPETVSTIITP